MLRVNLDDGSTFTLDLENASDAQRWLSFVRDPVFQGRIRALQLASPAGATHTLARPVLDAPVTWDAELGHDRGRVVRETVIAFSDPVRIALHVYRRSPAFSSVSVERVGRRVLSPPRPRSG